MTKKVAYLIPIDGDHFEFIAEQIAPMYLRDPLDFLFIGPSGFYVRQVADSVARRVGKAINRDAFRVINQYVTEILKLNNYDAEVFDRDFYTVYVTDVIDKLAADKKFSGDSQKEIILRTLSKSPTIIEYIVDLFEKVWELTLYGDELNENQEKLKGTYAIIYEILQNPETPFAEILSEIIRKMQESAEKLKGRKIYDPISVYRWYVEEAEHVEPERKTLALSGFFDIPPLMQKSLIKMFEKAEEVLFFVWQRPHDFSFEQLDEVYEFIKESGFELKTDYCHKRFVSLGELKDRKTIEEVPIESQIYQYNYTASQIKRLLIEGENPDNIAVVTPSSSIARRLMEELDEAKVPYRYSGKIPLTQSKVVQILIQPLETYFNDLNYENILAIIESPLIPERKLTMDEIEDLFKQFGYFSVNLTQSLLKDKEKRNEIFFRKLEEEIEEIKAEKENIEIEEDVYYDTIKRLEQLEEFKRIMNDLFEILDDIFKSAQEKDFFEWYRAFILKYSKSFSKAFEKSQDSRLVSHSLGNEVNAFSKFIEIIDKLEDYTKRIVELGDRKSLESWRKIYRLLTVLLNSSGYRETFKSANVVDIVDLSNARFLNKKYKFFLEFTDDYYPSIEKINPLLFKTNSERSRIYQIVEERERRSLILSLLFSDISQLIVPLATNTGDMLVPSKYTSEFANKRRTEKYVPSLEDVYSEIDYEIERLKADEHSKKTLSESDFIVGPVDMKEFSFSKINTYMKCPLQFFYQQVLNIYKPGAAIENKKSINDGIIAHRIVKRFFELTKEKTIFEIDEKQIDEWLEEEYVKLYNEGIYAYSIPKELKIKEFKENLLTLMNLFVQSKKVITLGNRSLGMSQSSEESDKKPRKKNSTKVTTVDLVSDEIAELESEFVVHHEGYEFTVRVDRIDRISPKVVLSEDENVRHTVEETGGSSDYLIIDYKYSKVKNSPIEQLLFYDWVIQKSEKNTKYRGSDVYFVLFSLRFDQKEEKYSYEYAKRQNNGEAKIFLPGGKRGRISKYYQFDYQIFEDWLMNLIEGITEEGKFVPVFLSDEMNSFINSITADGEEIELVAPEGSKHTRKCRGFGQECSYEPICAMFEVYNVRLKK